MSVNWQRTVRRWSLDWHRDLGYFVSTLVLIYCISGLALNHVNEWNPDFIVHRELIKVPQGLKKEEVNREVIQQYSNMVKEPSFKVYDFPTPDKVKIYYEQGTLLVNLDTGVGEYERLTRRAVFYESNVLHRNSLEGWKWVADIFAIVLILITVTGLIILKGKYGFRRRGLYIMLAGLAVPVLGLFIFYITKQA